MPFPDAQHRLSFPGFNSLYAWIEVEGAPLKVYGVEQDGKKVVAYVEATNGKQFTVHYLDLTSTCSTSHVVRLYVDGSRVNGLVVKREESKFQDPPDDNSRKFVFEGSEHTRTAIRPCKFSTLQLTDDDGRACSDEQVVKNIGTVQLKYIQVDNVRSTDAFTAQVARKPTIHEKTKKAQLSHQVDFGDHVDIPAAPRLAFDSIDGEDTRSRCLSSGTAAETSCSSRATSRVPCRRFYPSLASFTSTARSLAAAGSSVPPALLRNQRALPSPVIQPDAARRRASSSATPAAESSSKAARLAKLKREHAELEREEIDALEAESEEDEAEAEAGAKRVKRGGELRVKVEGGGLMVGAVKGRAKGTPNTLVLSDSE